MTWQLEGFTELGDLGAGASGRVVVARHDVTETLVAIKYLGDELRLDPMYVASFRAEARLLVEIEDVHIARLFEYVEHADGMAIVLELVDGVPLSEFLATGGPLVPEAALYVLAGSLAALEHAHRAGIVHRDYKPANVLVTSQGESKLIDFGIAARSGQRRVAAGTPAYMAPEQWRGQPATASSDMYAATATLFECVTGRPPFVGADFDLLRLQHENAPVPFEAVPEPLQALVKRGLAKRPEGRPASAAAFLAELNVAAVAGYGADWEQKGRAALTRRAALLAGLLPLRRTALDGSAVATTRLGRKVALAAGVMAFALLGGGAVAAAHPGLPASHRTSPPLTTVVTAGPSGSVRASTPPSSIAPSSSLLPSTLITEPPLSPTPIASRSRPAPPTGPTRPPRTHAPPTGPPTVPPTVPPGGGTVVVTPTPTHPTVVTPTPTQTPTPTLTPTPTPTPPPTLQKLEITNFVWGEGGTGPDATAKLYVATSGPGAIQLVLHYSNGTDLNRTPPAMTLSGATTYLPVDAETFSGTCGVVTLTATTSVGGTATASLPAVPC